MKITESGLKAGLSTEGPKSGLTVETDPAGLRLLADTLEAKMKQSPEGENVSLWIHPRIMLMTPPVHHNGK